MSFFSTLFAKNPRGDRPRVYPTLLRRADLLAERAAVRKRMNVWRATAFLAFAVLIAISFFRSSMVLSPDHIASIRIDGVMVSDLYRQEAIMDLAHNGRVKAVIVHINSPGGTFAGGESVYRALRHVARQKPVVAVFGDVGTSAAYMAALGADWILANNGTITASVGVIMQSANIVDLLQSIGVRTHVFKSGELKASPNLLEHPDQNVQHAVRTIIDRSFRLFLDMVKERREIDDTRLEMVSDGRIMLGHTAYENGFIDGIGARTEAIEWIKSRLKDRSGVERRLPVVEFSTTRKDYPFGFSTIYSFVQKLLSTVDWPVVGNGDGLGSGLLSVWQPGQSDR